MKSAQDLQVFFETEIKTKLDHLEGWRKNIYEKRKRYFILIVIYFFTVIILYFIKRFATDSAQLNGLFTLLIIPWIIGSPVLLYAGIHIMLNYRSFLDSMKDRWIPKSKRNSYKRIVIERIVKFISPDLKYTPGQKEIPGKEFLESEIFPHSIFYPIGYMAEDFVEGKIGKTHIRFYEINGRDMVFPDGGSGTQTYDGRVEKIPFYGMFCIVDFNKSFSGHTLVLPEKRTDRLQWITASGRKLLKLDNPEFEKMFSVFGTDQIAARYVLSTSLMQRIVEYSKKIRRPIRISFSNNKLFIAIKHSNNKFEFALSKPVDDFNQIKDFYYDLKIITDIVEDLNLNSRIWLKEGAENLKLYEQPTNHKYHKMWVYRLLVFPLGLLGLHYFYAGYRGKGLHTLLTSATVVLLLIFFYSFITSHLAVLVLILIFSTGWFFYVLVSASWIKRDSKGYPLQRIKSTRK